MWLFHLHSAVKIRAFYPVFPSSESTTTVFCWLFHWNFREKASTYFLWHRQTKQPYAMTEPSKKALLPTWWKHPSSAHYAALNRPPQPAWGLPTPFPEPKTQRLPHGGRQALSSPPRRGHSPCGLPKGNVRGEGRCGIPVGAGRRGLGLEQMGFNVLQC